MKLPQILAALLLTATSVRAFTTPGRPNSHRAPSYALQRRPQPVFAAASIDAEERTMSDEDRLQMEEEWRVQLQSDQVQEVRTELIEKYLSKGRDLEFAEKEVDKFLSDPERSQQYLEMRDYAKSQTEMGFESALQLGAAFAIGLIGNVGVKYYAAWKDAAPDQDLSQMFH